MPFKPFSTTNFPRTGNGTASSYSRQAARRSSINNRQRANNRRHTAAVRWRACGQHLEIEKRLVDTIKNVPCMFSLSTYEPTDHLPVVLALWALNISKHVHWCSGFGCRGMRDWILCTIRYRRCVASVLLQTSRLIGAVSQCWFFVEPSSHTLATYLVPCAWLPIKPSCGWAVKSCWFFCHSQRRPPVL